MTKKELIKRLETTCFGLDPIDPLRLLVDDVIEALTQTERTWVGLTDEEIKPCWYEACQTDLELTSQLVVYFAKAIEAKLKERNT